MAICQRCGRGHSGICGIPPGVTLGFGARIGSSSSRSNQPGKPRQKPKSANFLKGMLQEAKAHEKKLNDMLKVTLVNLPEYDDLLDRLGKLEQLILQLNWQIMVRESK